MTKVHLAWHAMDPGGQLIAVVDGEARTQFFEAPGANTHVIVVNPAATEENPDTYAETVRAGLSVPTVLDVLLVPAERQVITSTVESGAHFLRLADATVKQLEPAPDPIKLAPGDAYVALIPGGPPLTSEFRLAAARFIHLRDYFNANKLAADLLKHLLSDDQRTSPTPPALGVLVIECR